MITSSSCFPGHSSWRRESIVSREVAGLRRRTVAIDERLEWGKGVFLSGQLLRLICLFCVHVGLLSRRGNFDSLIVKPGLLPAVA
jgi:hypothetical protein